MPFFILTFIILSSFADSTGFQEISPEREKHLERRRQAYEMIRSAQGNYEVMVMEKKKKIAEEERIAREKKIEEERILKEKKAVAGSNHPAGPEEVKTEGRPSVGPMSEQHNSRSRSVRGSRRDCPWRDVDTSVCKKNKFRPTDKHLYEMYSPDGPVNTGVFSVRIHTKEVTCRTAMTNCLVNLCLNPDMPAFCKFNGKVLYEQNMVPYKTSEVRKLDLPTFLKQANTSEGLRKLREQKSVSARARLLP